jgi:hypothetical protein
MKLYSIKLLIQVTDAMICSLPDKTSFPGRNIQLFTCRLLYFPQRFPVKVAPAVYPQDIRALNAARQRCFVSTIQSVA